MLLPKDLQGLASQGVVAKSRVGWGVGLEWSTVAPPTQGHDPRAQGHSNPAVFYLDVSPASMGGGLIGQGGEEA